MRVNLQTSMHHWMIQGITSAMYTVTCVFLILIYAINVLEKPVITTKLIVKHGRWELNKNPNIFPWRESPCFAYNSSSRFNGCTKFVALRAGTLPGAGFFSICIHGGNVTSANKSGNEKRRSPDGVWLAVGRRNRAVRLSLVILVAR